MGVNWLAKARRLVAYFLTGIFPFLAFFLSIVFLKDVNVAAGLGVVVAIFMTFISNWVSSTPWVKIIEGSDLLCLNMSSSGIIEAYTLKIEPPFAIGNIAGKLKKIFFDRSAIFYLFNPRKGEMVEEKNEVVLKFDKSKYNSMRFDLYGVTTFIFNEQLGNFVTKDFFMEREQALFLKNQAFSVHAQLEDVRANLNYYASYVNQKLLKDKIFGIDMRLVVLLIIILIFVALFGQNVVDLINSVFGKAATSINSANPISVTQVTK